MKTIYECIKLLNAVTQIRIKISFRSNQICSRGPIGQFGDKLQLFMRQWAVRNTFVDFCKFMQ